MSDHGNAGHAHLAFDSTEYWTLGPEVYEQTLTIVKS